MRKPARDRPDPTEPRAAEEDFLGRWARRKRRARDRERAAGDAPRERAPAAAPSPPGVPGEAGAESPPGVPGEAEAESRPGVPGEAEAESPLGDADMPSLESLDEDSDYSGFLSPGVSEGLRRRALRKLFLSPKFNVVDGLDDYAEDFTLGSFAALGDVVTTDMRHRMSAQAERARQREEVEAAARAAEPSDPSAEPIACAHGSEEPECGPDEPGARPASDEDENGHA